MDNFHYEFYLVLVTSMIVSGQSKKLQGDTFRADGVNVYTKSNTTGVSFLANTNISTGSSTMKMEFTTLLVDLIGLSALSPNSSSNGTTEKVAIPEEFRRKYLQELQAQTTPSMIPATVAYLLLAVVGVVGNVFVLYVYSCKFVQNSTRVFILAIAACDLVTNVLVIPGEVYNMFHVWDFDNPWLCRTRLFINVLTTTVSATLLTALAVVRYRKVCVPFGWQISPCQAKIMVVVLIFVSVLCSVPYAAISGKHTRETPHSEISGHECSTDDMFVDTIWPILNTAFFIVLYLASSGTIVVLYCLVGCKTWHHDRTLGQGVPRAVGNSKLNSDISGAKGSTSQGNSVRLSSGGATKANTEKRKLNEKSIVHMRDSAFQTNVTSSDIGVSKETTSSKMIKMKSNGQSEDGRGRLEGNEEDKGNITQDFQSEEPQNAATIHKGACFIGENLIRRDTSSRCYHDVQDSDKNDKDTKVDPASKNSASVPTVKNQRHTEENFTNSSKHTVDKACIKPKRNLRRTTAMLVTISAVYILGYLPFLGLSLFITSNPKRYEALDGASLALCNLFMRSFLVNSASNAVIYGFYDLTFRAKCWSIIRRKLCCVMTQDPAIFFVPVDYHSTA